MTSHNIIQAVSLARTFETSRGGEATALAGITFSLERGGYLFITGPSGAGKSTLVKILYGALEPTKGEAVVCGRSISRLSRTQIAMLRRDVGVVHQEFNLIDNRTALENVILPLVFMGVGGKEARRRAEAALEQVELTDRTAHEVQELSGGERQRVALARALVVEPQVILADEPTGNLDRGRADQVFAILNRAHKQGVTIVVATHDLRRVDETGHAVMYISDGRIVAARGDVEARLQ